MLILASGDWQTEVNNIDRCQVFDLDSITSLYLVPYFRDPKRQRDEFQGALYDTSKKRINILAFHNEIAGCERTAFTKGEGLTLTDIGASSYKVCISGHI